MDCGPSHTSWAPLGNEKEQITHSNYPAIPVTVLTGNAENQAGSTVVLSDVRGLRRDKTGSSPSHPRPFLPPSWDHLSATQGAALAFTADLLGRGLHLPSWEGALPKATPQDVTAAGCPARQCQARLHCEHTPM